MRRRCLSHRGDARVVGPQLARHIIEVLLHADRLREGVAMVWLDGRRRLLDTMVVRCSERELEEAAAPVLDVGRSPVRAVVLGSWLPDGRRRPTREERRRYVRLRRRHADAGVELLDWFVLGPRGQLWSLAEEVERMT